MNSVPGMNAIPHTEAYIAPSTQRFFAVATAAALGAILIGALGFSGVNSLKHLAGWKAGLIVGSGAIVLVALAVLYRYASARRVIAWVDYEKDGMVLRNLMHPAFEKKARPNFKKKEEKDKHIIYLTPSQIAYRDNDRKMRTQGTGVQRNVQNPACAGIFFFHPNSSMDLLVKTGVQPVHNCYSVTDFNVANLKHLFPTYPNSN